MSKSLHRLGFALLLIAAAAAMLLWSDRHSRQARRAPPEGGGLLGSLATHAWVEVLLPGMSWAAPVCGIFKGSGPQGLKGKVSMRRIAEKS